MPHPPRTAYTYLADPRNRPEWQSSLLSVTLRERSEPYAGMRWRETTVVGVRPRMEIVEMAPYRLWTERGTWHGVTAVLTLRFTAVGEGCRVRATGEVTGSGAWSLAALSSGWLASSAIGADLRRASRILSDRGLR